MRKLIVLLILLVLLLPAVALAAMSYSASITVTENASVSYAQLPISVSVNNTYLAANNFITSTGLDTRVLATGTELPHMLTGDRTLFVSPVVANTQSVFSYTTGNSDLTSFPVIVGYNGYVTVADAAALELGNNFKVEFQGYINTDNGSDKNMVFKDGAFKVWVSAANEISASIYNGGWTATVVTATGVSSGVCLVGVTANVTALGLYINGSLKDTESLGGTISVPDTANNWILMQNNSMPYLEYLKIWVD